MSILKDALESGKFGVTAEMAPPKGYDFTEQMEAAGKKVVATTFADYCCMNLGVKA